MKISEILKSAINLMEERGIKTKKEEQDLAFFKVQVMMNKKFKMDYEELYEKIQNPESDPEVVFIASDDIANLIQCYVYDMVFTGARLAENGMGGLACQLLQALEPIVETVCLAKMDLKEGLEEEGESNEG